MSRRDRFLTTATIIGGIGLAAYLVPTLQNNEPIYARVKAESGTIMQRQEPTPPARFPSLAPAATETRTYTIHFEVDGTEYKAQMQQDPDKPLQLLEERVVIGSTLRINVEAFEKAFRSGTDGVLYTTDVLVVPKMPKKNQ